MQRTFFLALVGAALMGSSKAEDDPDLLRYPAPKLTTQTSGCATINEKSTIGDKPLTFRICIGDKATAQDYGCPSVADIYHTDKRLEDTSEDMKRRQKKFGCQDIDGLKLRVVEIYPETGHACGIDFNRNKWCLTVEGLEKP
jgi:hypothetical protein